MIKNIQYTCSSSKKSLNKGETSINMVILFENGCVGNVHMDISSIDQPKHVVEFHAEKDSILLQNNSNNFFDNFELTINSLKQIQKIKLDDVLNFSQDKSEDPRVKLIKPIATRFINWCNTGIKSKPTFQDGLRVQELIKMTRG